MNYKLKVEELAINGETFGKPKGSSMLPRITSGEKLLFIKQETYEINDIVLCKVKGTYMVHKIIAKNDNRGFQIANNKGRINGWTRTVFAKAFDVDKNPK